MSEHEHHRESDSEPHEHHRGTNWEMVGVLLTMVAAAGSGIWGYSNLSFRAEATEKALASHMADDKQLHDKNDNRFQAIESQAAGFDKHIDGINLRLKGIEESQQKILDKLDDLTNQRHR